MTVEYTVIEKVPSAEAFCHLRVAAGMSPRPWKAPEPGCRIAVTAYISSGRRRRSRWDASSATARLISILLTSPSIRLTRKGLGRLVMEKLIAWLDANAFDGAYVTLVADVPELYAKFGFESVRPESEGMARVWRTRSR